MSVVTIIGSGMMGSALAFPARENGHEVRLVGTHLDADIIDACRKNNRHPKFDYDFPEGVKFYRIEEDAANMINETKKNGGRIICVGTTSCRTLESAAAEDGTIRACSGWTDIFIYPGYQFKILDCLITNFHLPESTLVMLVSALAGREHVLTAYEEAIRQRYRFFSFGDAMFIQ